MKYANSNPVKYIQSNEKDLSQIKMRIRKNGITDLANAITEPFIG